MLPPGAAVRRSGDHWVIRSPANPGHYWGNWLLYDVPPTSEDRERWLADFEAELPGCGHRLMAWDTVDGRVGAAADAFPDFELEPLVGLIAAPAEIVAHPAAAAVEVRAIDPDGPEWEGVLAIWLAGNAEGDRPHPPAAYEAYARRRMADLRTLFRDGRGGWFVVCDGDEVVGSLGVVVTGRRARYQAVDVLASHRRRGIARRMVAEAARQTAERFPGVTEFVMCAEPDYHAIGIYESLGFRRAERVASVCRRPPGG